jgi:signal transduction histidine kinase
MVQVAIRDRGVGIRPEDVPRLFRKFSRLEGPHAESTGGTGVGLYLAKSMVEAQRGSIWVDSKPGKGSAFCFALPVARTPPNDAPG